MTTEARFDPYAVLQVVSTAEHEVVHGAFKALAFKYHPDRDPSRRAAARMAELNRAYAILRDEGSRAAHDRDSRRTTISGINVAATAWPAAAPPPNPLAGSVLQFGRYTGWGLRDVASRDPEYLVWLSRHSSGIRYRTEIYGILHTMGVSAA